MRAWAFAGAALAFAAAALGSVGCRDLLGIHVLSDDMTEGGSDDGGSGDATQPEAGPIPDAAADSSRGGSDASTDARLDTGALPMEAGCSGLVCDGGCVPNDLHNCGACGNDCTSLSHVSATGLQCVGGMCVYSCATGFSDCADAGHGCPNDLSQNGNCGGCGVTCSTPTPLCQGDICASTCTGTTPDLCGMDCTNKQTDPNNCGTCGNVCATSVAHALPTCATATCGYACDTSLGYTPCTGACVDESSDNDNCGGCGTSCTGGKQCTAGQCQCPGGTHACGGSCSSNTSTASCGATSCSACQGPASGTGTASCDGASCGVACSGSTPTYCSTTNACVDTTTDANNCGGCGMACPANMPVCSGGSCHPPPTWCTTQSPPAGVAAADFQCLDFDMGLPGSSWTQTQSTSGTFSLSTAAFSSSPNSLLMSVPAAADASHQGVATLAWTNVEAANIQSITVSAQINPNSPGGGVFPAWTGDVDVLCVKFNGEDSKSCLQYLYGSPTKLRINWVFIPGAAAQGFCDVPLWTYNTWNSVQLSLAANGVTTVTLNGATTTCTPTLTVGPDTSATITVGPQAFSVTNFPVTAYYDNVLAYVSR